jgi:hypothetical protein
LNKVTGISKLKKNQQQTQYYQDSVHEDLGANVASKAKSLGKKGPCQTNSIREKTAEKIGQKNLIKALKSNFNNQQVELSRKA